MRQNSGDQLIASDDALAEWLTQFPRTDTQQIRALIRQARKDAPPEDRAAESQGLAPRKGRAYRDLYQLVRLHMGDAAEYAAEEQRSRDA